MRRIRPLASHGPARQLRWGPTWPIQSHGATIVETSAEKSAPEITSGMSAFHPLQTP